jgi:photosystem II stability/assembly factor-like uncharacterized protein
LNGLAFINGKTGFAVGDNGTLVRSEDSGDSWQLMMNPFSGKLNDICFITQSQGVIIGENGRLYATSDSGKSWINCNFPAPYLNNMNLNSVCSIDGQNLIIVGDKGRILKED